MTHKLGNYKPKKHGNFKHLAEKAARKKEFVYEKENGLGGYAPVMHTFSRELLPLIVEYGKYNRDAAILYFYLLANTNGQPDNDRYMSAFKSVETIAAETGISKNNISYLSDVLEALGMIETAYDYTSNKRDKLYYPQYYSDVPIPVIRERMAKLKEEREAERKKRNAGKDYDSLSKKGA